MHIRIKVLQNLSYLRFLVVFMVTMMAWSLYADEPAKVTGEATKKGVAATEVEVRFVDGSTMKLQLRDDKVELETDYGKLLIPVKDIRRIDFSLRMSDETRKQIFAAIKDLENSDFRRREAAANLLTGLKDKAYPALSQAKTKDPEAERRIEQIIEKIRETSPTEALEVPPHDVVHTASSRIAGRIKADTMRVGTLPFGDQAVKLADMRTLRLGGFGDPESVALSGAAGGILDGGLIHQFSNQVGKTFSFRVTAPPVQAGGRMGVYGTDVYTMDSSLPGAALHAGILRPGETGVVRVTFIGEHNGFVPSLRNGVMSNGYGPWTAFRIEQPKGGPRPK